MTHNAQNNNTSDFATTSQVRNENKQKGHGTMREQFSKFKENNSLRVRQKSPKAHSTAVTDWKGDGVDHINISTSGRTAIGQFLAHNSDNAVVSPIFGRFPSVRALWMWLLSADRDDRYRNRGHNAGRNQNAGRRQVPNFRAIILDTDWNKLKQYPAAAEALKKSTAPLDTYFYDTETKIRMPRRPSTFYWLVEGWEELRRALREGVEPDLSPWLDVPGSGVYDFAFNTDGVLPPVIEKADQVKRVKRFHQGENPQPRQRKDRNAPSIINLTNTNASVDASTDPVLSAQVSIVKIDNPVDTTTEQAPTQDIIVVKQDTVLNEQQVAEQGAAIIKDFNQFGVASTNNEDFNSSKAVLANVEGIDDMVAALEKETRSGTTSVEEQVRASTEEPTTALGAALVEAISK